MAGNDTFQRDATPPSDIIKDFTVTIRTGLGPTPTFDARVRVELQQDGAAPIVRDLRRYLTATEETRLDALMLRLLTKAKADLGDPT